MSGPKHTESNIQNDIEGFSRGPVVKSPPCNARDTGSIPGQGRSHVPRSY